MSSVKCARIRTNLDKVLDYNTRPDVVTEALHYFTFCSPTKQPFAERGDA